MRSAANDAFAKASSRTHESAATTGAIANVNTNSSTHESASAAGAALTISAADTPKIARKRKREARTVSQMIAIYCRGHHDRKERTCTGYCGESMCEECKALDDYALKRTMRCKKMDKKISCELCENHCYAREARDKIRAVMRYSGPRMLKSHPVAAIRHLAGKISARS